MINYRLHRFKKRITQIIILSTIYYLLSTVTYAQALSSSELINNARHYDGKTVVFAGEVIGDIMVRGDFAWMNVYDGQNAIGIWINRVMVKDILFTGSYKAKGDWVEVTGIFNRACPLHGGDLDIHALTIRQVRQGKVVREKLNIRKRNQAIVLLGILGLVWILTLLKRR
jgi:hypothetical protein